MVGEGACNSGTAEWKRWRDGVHRRMLASKGERDWPAALHRRWVHTGHERVGDRWQCVVCGEVRKWG